MMKEKEVAEIITLSGGKSTKNVDKITLSTSTYSLYVAVGSVKSAQVQIKVKYTSTCP